MYDLTHEFYIFSRILLEKPIIEERINDALDEFVGEMKGEHFSHRMPFLFRKLDNLFEIRKELKWGIWNGEKNDPLALPVCSYIWDNYLLQIEQILNTWPARNSLYKKKYQRIVRLEWGTWRDITMHTICNDTMIAVDALLINIKDIIFNLDEQNNFVPEDHIFNEKLCILKRNRRKTFIEWDGHHFNLRHEPIL